MGRVFFGEGADGFEFDDELGVYDEVGSKVAEQTAVFIVDGDGHLLLDGESLFPEAIAERVFVNLFVVTVTEKGVGLEGSLADDIGELKGGGFVHGVLRTRIFATKGTEGAKGRWWDRDVKRFGAGFLLCVF